MKLERKAVEVIEIDAAVRSLAERAKSELGYDGLLKKWERPLADALRELGIEPFTLKSVSTYKDARLAEMQDKLKQLRISKEEKLAWNGKFTVKIGWKPKKEITLGEHNADTIGTRYMWNRALLSRYHGEVPAFVAAKALEIKAKVPAVNFEIEYLRYHYDPFLVATLGDERHYVEVWDEPRFEESLISYESRGVATSSYVAPASVIYMNSPLSALGGLANYNPFQR